MWRGQVKELYLRWRHDDPWKAEIITYRSDGPKWSRLDIPDFTSDGDLDKIKRAAILAAKELLNGSRHDRAAIEQRAKEDLAAVIFKEIDAREWDAHGRLPVTTVKAIITRELRKKPKE
jgi:hypothetical protein